MKRRVRFLLPAILCLCILVSGATPALAASGTVPAPELTSTGDEVQAAKKIISVVYDDSGSMAGESWVYTSYAMQALTALLNAQDELYITYMSQPDQPIQMGLDNIPGAVDDIRNWNHRSGTPAKALDTARGLLDKVQEKDATAQFWLVVLTDGVIDGLNSGIQNKMESFAGNTMGNGTPLNVVYLSMGGGADQVTPNESKGLYSYHSQSAGDIFSAMAQIANLISGRFLVDPVTQVDDHTISFSSKLPLYTISILSQQVDAEVTEARTQEAELHVDRNIPLDAFEPQSSSTATLHGNAAVIGMEAGPGLSAVIPAGTYTVVFSQPVSISDLVVQYEPAIGLMAEVTKDGVVVSDTGQLADGDKVDIRIVPIIPGTTTPLTSADLPSGISWQIEYEVDGSVEDSGAGTELTGVTLQIGQGVIRGTMQIPGYAPLIQEIQVNITQEAVELHLGLDADVPDPLTYQRAGLGGLSEEGAAAAFRITNDGVPLTKQELKDFGLSLSITGAACDNSGVTGFLNRIGFLPAVCSLRLEDDGSYLLIPKAPMVFTAFLIRAGVYTVDVAVSSDPSLTASASFTVVPQVSDWLWLLVLLLILLAIITLIYVLFIKYKFTGQTVCCEYYQLLSNGEGIPRHDQDESMVLKRTKGLFPLHRRASQVNFLGLTLVAGPDGLVYITGKSIAACACQYGTSSSDPEEYLDSIISQLMDVKTRGGAAEAADQALTTTPVYFRTSEYDNMIWRVYLEN